MIRFPYILQRWNHNTDEWQTVSRCNARYDGKARFIESPNGKVIEYTYEVVMPQNVLPLEENEEVRILDRCGKNIFDHRLGAPIGSTLEDRCRTQCKASTKADKGMNTRKYGSKRIAQ